jgi:hypothetical protein
VFLIENLDVVGREESHPFHLVTILTLRRCKDNQVTPADPLELAEVRVPMTGDSNVSWLSKSGSPFHMPDASI